MAFINESVKYILESVLSCLFLTFCLRFLFLAVFHTFNSFNYFWLLCQVVPLNNQDFVSLP